MVNLDIVKSTFVFFKEFVWGKLNIRSFLYRHRLVLLALLSNAVMTFMYIYFAEQAIVRTSQYREQKTQIAKLNTEIERLTTYNEDLNIKIQYLNNIDKCDPDVNSTASKLMTNYEIWRETVETDSARRRRLNQEKRDATKKRYQNTDR